MRSAGPGELSLGRLVSGLVPVRGYVQNAGLALDHDGLCFGQGAGDEGYAGCVAVFDLSADPLGACAGLAEASASENEPGVPVAFGWEL